MSHEQLAISMRELLQNVLVYVPGKKLVCVVRCPSTTGRPDDEQHVSSGAGPHE
jgi:hypothetical protein